MKVQKIMTTQVHTCRPHDSLNEAAKVLWENDCGCVPVVDESGSVVGMLTDRDICMAAYLRGESLKAIPVSTAMSKECLVCAPTDSVKEAEQIMQANKVRRLPVVDRARQLVGLLSLSDLAREAALERTKRRKFVKDADVGLVLSKISEPRFYN